MQFNHKPELRNRGARYIQLVFAGFIITFKTPNYRENKIFQTRYICIYYIYPRDNNNFEFDFFFIFNLTYSIYNIYIYNYLYYVP